MESAKIATDVPSRTVRQDAGLRRARRSGSVDPTGLFVEPGKIYVPLPVRGPAPSCPFAGGPLRRPDVVAPPMEPDRTPVGQVAFNFRVVGRDRQVARYAHPAGARAVPGHPTVLLRQVVREDLVADGGSKVVFRLAHV